MSTALPLSRPEPWGHGLHRPECVVATAAGDVFVPDWRGGVSVVRSDGSQQSWMVDRPAIDLRPNAVALTPDGAFLLANLGDDGGIWRLTTDGEFAPVVTDVDGIAVPPTNFVTMEPGGRLWGSVSTRMRPRQLAFRPAVRDGFIFVRDEHGARIVADGLHYTNEVRPDPSGRWLYAIETFGRRLVRFSIQKDSTLGSPELVTEFGYGTFPDGFAFDADEAIWVTSLVSNRLLRVHEGRVQTLLEDLNEAFVAEAERAFAEGSMGAQHLGPIPGTTFQQITSVAFGGPDRRTGFLGSLHAGCVYRFRAALPGAENVHSTYRAP